MPGPHHLPQAPLRLSASERDKKAPLPPCLAGLCQPRLCPAWGLCLPFLTRKGLQTRFQTFVHTRRPFWPICSVARDLLRALLSPSFLVALQSPTCNLVAPGPLPPSPGCSQRNEPMGGHSHGHGHQAESGAGVPGNALHHPLHGEGLQAAGCADLPELHCAVIGACRKDQGGCEPDASSPRAPLGCSEVSENGSGDVPAQISPLPPTQQSGHWPAAHDAQPWPSPGMRPPAYLTGC